METFEAFEMEVEITNETKKTLFEAKGVPFTITFFWDSHGKLVPFPGGPKEKKTYNKSCADVKIIERKYTMYEQEWQQWDLYINGELFNGSVYRYNFTGSKLLVKMIIGWG
jgi:hypothetical protein